MKSLMKQAHWQDDSQRDYEHAERCYANEEFSPDDLIDHVFMGCTFQSCSFRDCDLTQVVFRDCTLRSCDWTLCRVDGCFLDDVLFTDCRIAGVNFMDCNRFGFRPQFQRCLMNNVVFASQNLKKFSFEGSSLKDCDFNDCDLQESVFQHCKFHEVEFHQCDLRKADFRWAEGYRISPEGNRLAQARFHLPEAESFLGFLGIDVSYAQD
ncbi:MAG: pentapeptide repeat-containing protein [Spirochaetales bacterium]|nr:pentapeptide repeat-containing protein [Spirochaetales bacterium]